MAFPSFLHGRRYKIIPGSAEQIEPDIRGPVRVSTFKDGLCVVRLFSTCVESSGTANGVLHTFPGGMVVSRVQVLFVFSNLQFWVQTQWFSLFVRGKVCPYNR